MDAASTTPALSSLASRFASSTTLNLNPSAADPFAEIFARMSIATPPPPPQQVAEPKEGNAKADSSSEVDPESSEDDETTLEAADAGSPSASVVGALATPTQPVERITDTVAESEEAATALTDVSIEESKQQSADVVTFARQPTVEAKTEVTNDKPEIAPELIEPTVDESLSEPTVDLVEGESKLDHKKENESLGTPPTDSLVTAETTIKSSESSSTVESDGETNDDLQAKKSTIEGTEDRHVERRRYNRDDNSQRSPEPSSAVQGDEKSSSNSVDSTNGNQGTIDSNLASENTTPSTATSQVTPPQASPLANVVTPTATATSLSTVASKPVTASPGSSSSTESIAPTKLGTNVAEASDPAVPKQNDIGGANQFSAVQRAKLVQRVSRGFQHLGRDGGNIRLRLSPDELGSVQLDIQIRDGKMRGRMITQTEAASGLLRDQLPELRASLQQQGIQLESLDIQHDASGQFNNNEATHHNWQEDAKPALPRWEASRKKMESPSTTTPDRIASKHTGSVDLVA